LQSFSSATLTVLGAMTLDADEFMRRFLLRIDRRSRMCSNQFSNSLETIDLKGLFHINSVPIAERKIEKSPNLMIFNNSGEDSSGGRGRKNRNVGRFERPVPVAQCSPPANTDFHQHRFG
jgi:hypothetical protein